MSKPAANPFFEADFSKYMDVSKMMDMSNMQKMMGEFKLPGLNMEAMMAAHRKNIETITATNQMMFENIQSLCRRQTELARQNFEATTGMVQAMMTAQTPEEKVAKQTEVTKATMERCMANLKELTEMMTRNQYQAMEAMSTRMCESMDEIQGMIKSSARGVASL